MILLGFILIRKVFCVLKGITKVGLEFRFYDVVVDQYTYQDNAQAMVILYSMIRQVHKDILDILEIILGSDNSLCFASHNIISFIDCFNNKLKTEDVILVVIK